MPASALELARSVRRASTLRCSHASRVGDNDDGGAVAPFVAVRPGVSRRGSLVRGSGPFAACRRRPSVGVLARRRPLSSR